MYFFFVCLLVVASCAFPSLSFPSKNARRSHFLSTISLSFLLAIRCTLSFSRCLHRCTRHSLSAFVDALASSSPTISNGFESEFQKNVLCVIIFFLVRSQLFIWVNIKKFYVNHFKWSLYQVLLLLLNFCTRAHSPVSVDWMPKCVISF